MQADGATAAKCLFDDNIGALCGSAQVVASLPMQNKLTCDCKVPFCGGFLSSNTETSVYSLLWKNFTKAGQYIPDQGPCKWMASWPVQISQKELVQ